MLDFIISFLSSKIGARIPRRHVREMRWFGVMLLKFPSSVLLQDRGKPVSYCPLEFFPSRAEIQQYSVTPFISSQQELMFMLTLENRYCEEKSNDLYFTVNEVVRLQYGYIYFFQIILKS